MMATLSASVFHPPVRLLTLFLVLLCTTFVGCQRYAVSVNDNRVYEPPALFADYDIRDRHLKSCIQDIIIEDNIRAANQLKRVVCASGDISDLSGLSRFTEIEQLGLAGNSISSITELAKLTSLSHADLSSNNIANFTPLSTLPRLKYLKLSGNSAANCDSIQQEQVTKIEQYVAPEHC